MMPPDEVDHAFARFQRTGSPRELAAVYDALAPELLRLALHTTGQVSDAEDVLQATFVTAIERAPSFDPARRVLPWLTGILANEARALRRRRGLPPDPERVATNASATPAHLAESRELDQVLVGTLERAPAAFRSVLRLHFVHGLDVAEIARVLERPAGTIRSRLARGTEFLRRALPAGLRAGTTSDDERDSLARVRALVLAHPGQTPVPPWQLPLGLLAMKKLLASAAALLALFVLWHVSRPDTSVEGTTPASLTTLERSMASGPLTQPAAQARREEPPHLALTPEPAQAPRDAPAAAATTLLVEARWPAGEPAAGEVVLLTSAEHERLDAPLVATTGADGRARLELAPGSVLVRLLRGGERSILLPPGKETTLTLELRPGVLVLGRVLDGDDRAVPGAQIWLSERYRTNLGHVLATSDAEGRFELRCVGPDHWIGARKPGFAPGRLARVPGGGARELVLRLHERGGELRGRVRDEQGTPVAGARLRLGPETPSYVRELDGSFVPERAPLWTTSAADGSFSFEGAPLGLAPLAARARGAAPWSGEVEIQERAGSVLELTLTREARVSGRVLDAQGQPRSVQVGAGVEGTLAGATTWSGTDGHFELAGVATGRVEVWARDGAEEARVELHLAPGETRAWEARLVRTPRIHGRVLDAHGSPVGGLTVVAVWPEQRDMRSRSQPTDAEGRFELGPLAEREHLVLVHPPDGWREFPLVEVADVRPAEAELLLTLPAPLELATLTAEVVAPGGTPLGGAELGLWHEERAVWRGFVSDENGRIVARGLPQGHVRLELRHPDHPWLRLEPRTLSGGETIDLGRLEFAPSGRLRVRLDPRAEDLQGLTMLLTGADGLESGVLRLHEGELESGALAAGRHGLWLGADGYLQVQREIEIRAGVEELVRLSLEPCGGRTVRIVLPDGAETPAWIACALFDADRTQVWRGNVEVARAPLTVRVHAPPGEHTLYVNADGGLAGRLTLLVPGRTGELPELELLLARTE